MGCGNVSINYFGGENSSLKTIGFQAFRSVNTIAKDVTEITPPLTIAPTISVE